MTIHATEYETRREALEDVGPGEVAIVINGRKLVTTREETDRLEMARATFAFLYYLPESDQIVTVPVN